MAALSQHEAVSLRLLLVRHGLSSFNVERRIQGRDDLSTLTAEGENQARRLGQALANVPITAVYSSPLKRAASTAAGILEARHDDLDPSFDQGLLEIDLEPWSGLTAAERSERFPEDFATWKRTPESLELTRKDGSRYRPYVELMKQARNFLDELVSGTPSTVMTPCCWWATTPSCAA